MNEITHKTIVGALRDYKNPHLIPIKEIHKKWAPWLTFSQFQGRLGMWRRKANVPVRPEVALYDWKLIAKETGGNNERP